MFPLLYLFVNHNITSKHVEKINSPRHLNLGGHLGWIGHPNAFAQGSLIHQLVITALVTLRQRLTRTADPK